MLAGYTKVPSDYTGKVYLEGQVAAQIEQLFDLREENKELRKQITYLQEELASAEDKLMECTEHFTNKIDELETLIGELDSWD